MRDTEDLRHDTKSALDTHTVDGRWGQVVALKMYNGNTRWIELKLPHSVDYYRFTDIIEVNGCENELQYKIVVKIQSFTPNTSLKVNSLCGFQHLYIPFRSWIHLYCFYYWMRQKRLHVVAVGLYLCSSCCPLGISRHSGAWGLPTENNVTNKKHLTGESPLGWNTSLMSGAAGGQLQSVKQKRGELQPSVHL